MPATIDTPKVLRQNKRLMELVEGKSRAELKAALEYPGAKTCAG